MTDDRIRVWITINCLGIGGEERRTWRLVRAIDKQRFNVTVAYYDASRSELRGQIERAGVRVLCLDRRRVGRLPFFFKTAKLMRQERVNVVHAVGGSANVYGRVPAVMAGVPVVLGGIAGQSTLVWWARLPYAITSFGSCGWITNAEILEPMIRKAFWLPDHMPVFVIPNGLLPARQINFRSRQVTEYDMITRHRLVVGAVGRLDPVKNFPMYLAAAEKVIARRDDVEFWLIGDGPMARR